MDDWELVIAMVFVCVLMAGLLIGGIALLVLMLALALS